MSREALDRHTVKYFRRGLRTGPDVRLVEVDGQRYVVKDWKQRSLWRRLLGRLMLRREYNFLRRLESLEGVPGTYGFADADALAIEFLDGQTVAEVNPGHFSGIFDRLDVLLGEIHGRGIAHGDLDQDENIMVLSSGHPALLDFGGAVSGSTWLMRPIYDMLRRHDLHCASRLREKFRMEPDPIRPVPPPPLKPWQRFLLRRLRKMDLG